MQYCLPPGGNQLKRATFETFRLKMESSQAFRVWQWFLHRMPESQRTSVFDAEQNQALLLASLYSLFFVYSYSCCFFSRITITRTSFNLKNLLRIVL